jgi:hypothetical protein
MRTLRRFDAEDGGQMIVLGGLMLMTLLFAVGLAIDAGQLYVAKRTEQEAADAAAFAGAIVIFQGGANPPLATTVAAAITAATDDATRNGYTDGVNNTTVVINSPPTSGNYNGNLNHVEVIITRQVRTSLVPAESVLNPVRARGVAGSEPLNNGYAVIALNRGNTPNAFTDANNADIHLVGGGILVNSTSSSAATNSQTNCSRFTISTGTVDINGGSPSTWPSGCVPPFPSVNTSVPQQADPLAGFPKPSTAGLPLCPSLAACRDAFGNQNPGIYQVSLGGAGGTTLYLNTGIYILQGHGINEAGNADIQSCTPALQLPQNCIPGGVFIFNTLTNYPNPGGTCQGLTLAGNGQTNINPLTTGIYANFLFYQDPACTAGMSISGNGALSGFNAGGTVYLPSASVTFNGNNATLTGGQLIANTVNVQNGNLNITFSSGTSAQPVLPRLAE